MAATASSPGSTTDGYLRLVRRSAPGAFSASLPIHRPGAQKMSDLAAAVDPQGRAFVTWRETQGTTRRILVAQAPIGGSFTVITLAKGTDLGRPVITPAPRWRRGRRLARPRRLAGRHLDRRRSSERSSKVSDALTGDDRDGAQADADHGARPARRARLAPARRHRAEHRPDRLRRVGLRLVASAPVVLGCGACQQQPFVDKLNEQIAYEYGAHQQYVANAVWFDAQTLPRLAAFFYAQALEERGHAMMMVQYLLDSDAR